MGFVLTSVLVASTVTPAGAVTKSQLKAKALALSNLPTGWSVDNATSGGTTNSSCLKGLSHPLKHDVRVMVAYENGTAEALSENLEAGSNYAASYKKFVTSLSRCKTISFSGDGQTLKGTAGAMSFPKVGNRSSAFSFSVSDKGVSVGVDLVGFQVGKIVGDVVYLDLGTPDIDQLQGFLNKAVNKIEGKAA
jgi:hypothetical protein